MTRETKIGLLVGLVFIIVVGILLSENFHGASELPQAALDRAGSTARLAVNVPGAAPMAQPAPAPTADVTPRSRLATPRDLETPASPILADNTPKADIIKLDKPAALPGIDPALAATAKANGVELTPVNENPKPAPLPSASAVRSYTASPGDSVSKLAARFLGANTKTNRDLIIAANPSLRDNPNKIIVGESYDIPAAGAKSATPAAVQPSAPISSTARWTYTVKSNDTLWGIASTQLGNAGYVDAIKELNRDLLKGSTSVRPGMKLTLPAKPVAFN